MFQLVAIASVYIVALAANTDQKIEIFSHQSIPLPLKASDLPIPNNITPSTATPLLNVPVNPASPPIFNKQTLNTFLNSATTSEKQQNKVSGADNKIDGKTNSVYGNNNNIIGNLNVMQGNQNALNGFENSVWGADNKIIGTANSIVGNNNKNLGEKNQLIGNSNYVVGGTNLVSGNQNNLLGQKNYVWGKGNILKGEDNYIAGFQNSIVGSSSIVKGEKNTNVGNDNVVFGKNNVVIGWNNQIGTGSAKGPDLKDFQNSLFTQTLPYKSLTNQQSTINNNTLPNIILPLKPTQLILQNSKTQSLEQKYQTIPLIVPISNITSITASSLSIIPPVPIIQQTPIVTPTPIVADIPPVVNYFDIVKQTSRNPNLMSLNLVGNYF